MAQIHVGRAPTHVKVKAMLPVVAVPVVEVEKPAPRKRAAKKGKK